MNFISKNWNYQTEHDHAGGESQGILIFFNLIF